MPTIQRFEEIEAWQTARKLTRLVYTQTREGDFARDFGLRDQMRRSAVSIMSNIADGFESRTRAQFIDYLGRAKGSAGELRSQTYIAMDAGYLSDEDFQELIALCEKTSRQISGFMKYLRQNRTGRRTREDRVEYVIDHRHTH